MSEGKEPYRKKQAYLMILVFACIGVAIWGHSAAISVGSMLAACALAFYAASMQPAKAPDEHHH
ncbi:MAG: hypothetical protein M0P73_02135 [Syntrophobacterales bacterium]|jgi:predicted signal transduction protein with EAL and GGDEF domain|nr:hypothetical protein [Syntrophobacterales bacterium]